ncbi:hypothetical protein SAMN04489727_1691 [Amycolatopsis tolypomycina]|uniref:Uncharacterized protein n=1 Tax=Amycolatopsis tolypomycina TaxID=208445 RepID=A0A1H4JA45_9PSEU|nr:hypothetical protein [Amycolatopsis tolypomycina]SEB43194.1 hypothetical protein SAMN04489727_1691 [Amycolatopsis tolypomycina]
MARRRRWIEQRDGSAKLSALGLREMLAELTAKIVNRRAEAARLGETAGLAGDFHHGQAMAYADVLSWLDTLTLGEFGEERPELYGGPAPEATAGGEA